MCRQACPVGHVTRRETLTPHGWGMLIASERRGVVSWTPEVADAIYSCADCGLCQAHCATGPAAAGRHRRRARVHRRRRRGAGRRDDLHARLARWGNPYAEAQPLNAATREAARRRRAVRRRWHAVAGGGDTLTAALALLASDRPASRHRRRRALHRTSGQRARLPRDGARTGRRRGRGGDLVAVPRGTRAGAWRPLRLRAPLRRAPGRGLASRMSRCVR